MPTIRLHIKGKVQGVFYRATAKKVADKLGLKGWIKNKKNNCVEALVSGNENNLKEFKQWCQQGPDDAKVENVFVTNEKDITSSDFDILRK